MEKWLIAAISVSCIGFTAIGAALLRRWLQGPSCTSKGRMDGKVVVITGANTGIGKETAKELAKRGAKVVLLCRNMDKARNTAEEIRTTTGGLVRIFQVDLENLSSVRNASNAVKAEESLIHCLINNAGIMMCPEEQTIDGFEKQFATNHLGHFLLTLLLLENLKAASPSRIITISSIAHTKGQINWEDINHCKNYDPKEAYCQSKLANILFTKHLAKILEGSGVTTYAVHPGVVHTELGRHLSSSTNSCIHWAFQSFGKLFFKTAKKGAQTTVYCAVEDTLKEASGKYYSDCREKRPHPRAEDEAEAEKLWELSMKMVGLGYHCV